VSNAHGHYFISQLLIANLCRLAFRIGTFPFASYELFRASGDFMADVKIRLFFIPDITALWLCRRWPVLNDGSADRMFRVEV